MPVSMDDGTAIAAAPEIVCPLPGVARSGQRKRPRFFCGWFAPPDLSQRMRGGRECGGDPVAKAKRRATKAARKKRDAPQAGQRGTS